MNHNADTYRKCAAAGMTKMQTATALGVKYNTVMNAATKHGIKFSLAPMGRKPIPVQGKIMHLLEKPRTMQDLIRSLGLPTTTVRAIMARMMANGLVVRSEMIGQTWIWEAAA